MTSLLSGRHKYLTNKNTKKGQKLRKKLSVRERSHFLPLKTDTALSPQAKAVQHPTGSRFLKWYLFFCTPYPQTSWLQKSEKTREPPNREISGVWSHTLFIYNSWRSALKFCVAVGKEKAFWKKESGLCCNYGTSRFSAVRRICRG